MKGSTMLLKVRWMGKRLRSLWERELQAKDNFHIFSIFLIFNVEFFLPNLHNPLDSSKQI